MKNSNLISNSNFAKSSSLNKIKNNNYVTNYNNFYNNNNSFINKKVINPIMNHTKKNSSENQNSNIINNCQININNINYNNYNQNITQKSNQLFNEKIMKLIKKKNFMEVSKGKKIISQSQQEIKTKKKYKKNHTTNNSPINKIKSKSKTKLQHNKDNSFSNKNKHLKNSANNQPKQKSKIKTRDSNIPNTNNNNASNKKSNKKGLKKENIEEYLDISSFGKGYNSKNEIMALKKNLQKNNSENILKNNIIDSKNIECNRVNTISCTSSKTKDSNYYMEKCKILSNYIKQYYQEYQKYPPTNLNFYLYGRLIGQGAFGKVNIGLNILAGRVVAIKSFNKKELDENGENMKKILYETDLMKKLNHPNITKILEVFEDDDYILISMEYINGGNLFSFVKKRRKLSEKTAKYLFKQIILGIQHIHSHKIVHRDIKLENILIDLNNNIKICDFGIGKILTYNKQLLYDKCGTPMYMAPEILLSSKNHGYEGYPVDIWSAGISLYIMLSGTLPFNLKNNESSSMDESSENNIELQYSIINNEPKYIEKISDEARDLLKGLLNKNPNKRLTIDQILNHPWLQMDEKKGKNKKHHLFTKAEIIMLSKTYIDYRNGAIDDLKENFTLSNLKKDKESKKDKNKVKNISTKSSLLAPYNTLIQDDDEEIDYNLEDSLDDINNPNIILENDIILIKNKVKEFNLNYELNNNGECDNGMLINTKTGTISSSLNNSSKNDGKLTNRSRQRNEDENILSDLNDENDEQGEEYERKINKILDEIEKLGYDKKYVLNCVNKNILCYASSVFYLMLNYKDI
jgi:serine/threonine protein kinase